MNTRLQTKPSIDLFNLPKLRHKSTHISHGSGSKSPDLFTQEKRKSSLHFVPRPKHHKSFSKIQQNLQQHRTYFQQISEINASKLNKTFMKVDLNKKELQQKKQLQKRKVFAMETQEFLPRRNIKTRTGFKGHPSTFTLDNEKEKIYTGPMIVLDYKIEMSWLNHSCFDSLFNLVRTGATLSFKDDAVYLFGGNADNPQSNLMFHKYKLNTSQWQHVPSHGQKPTLSLMYHTCTSYKDLLIFIGGVCLNKTELKKFSNPHINLFHTQNNTWTEFHWGYHLKHHTACMVGNALLVYGGIDERERTENAVHMVYLNLGNLNYSKVNTFRSTEALSHHCMVTTINDDSRLRAKFKLDGVIVFGGKRGNEKLSADLMHLEASSLKVSDEDTSQVKKWQAVDIKGPKPEARMCHTFDLLTNKGLCVLMGGINQKNQYLNDLWVLDLFNLIWTQVKDVPLLQQTGGIAYHCSVVNESEIYIYGGISKNQTGKQFYLIETQKFKRQMNKHLSRKKINFSSNLISFKNFE